MKLQLSKSNICIFSLLKRIPAETIFVEADPIETVPIEATTVEQASSTSAGRTYKRGRPQGSKNKAKPAKKTKP